MSNLERRVNDLEVVLGELLAQSALAARRAEIENQFIKNQISVLRDEMKAFKDEMKEFKDGMKAFKDEMKEFKDEMKVFKDNVEKAIIELKDSTAELKDTTTRLSKEMSDSKAEMNKKWGDLANKLGTVVEDIVAPNIPAVAKKYFKIEHVQRLMMNLYIESETLKKGKEFDLILVAKDVVLLNETKTTIRQNYIDEFIQSLPEFFEFFPELKGKRLIPILSSMRFNPQQLAYLTKHKIYAMSMSGDTMELLNFEEISLA
ncbi:MAG: hypothetical protein SNJ55_08795 [Chloroherpetonaceae bacterium]